MIIKNGELAECERARMALALVGLGLLECIRDGAEAAKAVSDNWERGDLAGAVNGLDAWRGEAESMTERDPDPANLPRPVKALAEALRDAVKRLEGFIGTDCECDNTHAQNGTTCCLCQYRAAFTAAGIPEAVP